MFLRAAQTAQRRLSRRLAADSQARAALFGALGQRTGLSRHDLEQLEAQFGRLSGDGQSLSFEEFAAGMSAMSDGLQRRYFASLDTDRDGAIDFREFVCGVASTLQILPTESDKPYKVLKDGPACRVIWDHKPRTVLFVKKWKTPAVTDVLRDMGEWLQTQHGVRVVVEPAVAEHELPQFEAFDPAAPGDGVDFMVALGGDGTLLYLSSLFDGDADAMPPTISFGLGSLGFLTPFNSEHFRERLGRVMEGHRHALHCTMRSRLRCRVVSEGGEELGHYFALNECLIDRGTSPVLGALECYVDSQLVTLVQADGLIVSTPSGSTAYSLSAGGAMASPSVPCTLITPIAPHSLSFRPVVLPETAKIRVRVPESARVPARASFDNRNEVTLPRNSFVEISTAQYALPSINMNPFDRDWFISLRTKLRWNERVAQQAM